MDLLFPQDLRLAAQCVDRASKCPDGCDSTDALEVWEAVVTGSYSLVEWFDTDTRRFIVIRANPPAARDLRGLTKHERDVAGYAALGEANKLIAYRLGVSPTRVSEQLQSTIRKLDLRSKAQLVYWVRGLGLPVRRSGRENRLAALRKSA